MVGYRSQCLHCIGRSLQDFQHFRAAGASHKEPGEHRERCSSSATILLVVNSPCSLLRMVAEQCRGNYWNSGLFTASDKHPLARGLLKSALWGIPNCVCVFVVGFLCESFCNLAAELVHCSVRDRSRRNCKSTVCPEHRRAVCACGIKTKMKLYI